MKTPNYDLKKTELTDTFEDWIDNDAENWDIVDSALKSADEKSAEDISFTDTFNIADGATNVNSALINIGTKADTIKDRKYASVVVGTTQSGHTLADCDYLCDGTADQVKINTAIAALPADGGEIIILDGTYNITAKINLNKSNVTISGDGNSTILKRMYDSGSSEGVITLTSANYCKIKDLQIDGNKATYDSSNNIGIRLTSGSNNTVTGNTCNNNTSYGIFLTSSSNNNTVTGNTCNNNTYGIILTSSSNNTVTGNACNNNTSYGIFLTSSSTNTVTGNTCIRGTGLPDDYTSGQYTIRLNGTNNNYNLIATNNCMGKAVVVDGGTGNSVYGNKWDAGNDLE